MKKIEIVLLMSLVLLISCLACSMAQDKPNPTPANQPDTGYKLQIEDSMRILVWGEPNFTSDHVVVDPNGDISVPQAGSMPAVGLTVSELTDNIKKRLTKWLNDPKVQVTVDIFRKPKVSVLGQVNRPGLQEIKMGDKVMEAIASAGSFTEMAYLEQAYLTHKGSDERVPLNLRKLFKEGDLSMNFALQDGDTIYIPEDTTNKYFVLGEVQRPGMYRLKQDVSVVEALSTAGGPTQRGTLKSACILRGDAKNQQRLPVNIDKLLKKADMAQNVALQPGDVIYVPETSKPDWNKISGMISAIVNSSYLIRIWGL